MFSYLLSSVTFRIEVSWEEITHEALTSSPWSVERIPYWPSESEQVTHHGVPAHLTAGARNTESGVIPGAVCDSARLRISVGRNYTQTWETQVGGSLPTPPAGVPALRDSSVGEPWYLPGDWPWSCTGPSAGTAALLADTSTPSHSAVREGGRYWMSPCSWG